MGMDSPIFRCDQIGVPDVTIDFNQRPDGVKFVSDAVTMSAEDKADLESSIWDWILEGRDDAGEFVDYTLDDEFDGAPNISAEELSAAYDRAIDARLAQQEAWGPDARSNLTVAFAELDAAGIVARENFSCCGTCAAAEIHDEREEGRAYRGWLYFHEQDAEGLLESDDGEVYVGYGAYPPEDWDEEAYNQLPEQEREQQYVDDVTRLLESTVFPTLARHGMTVSWNGKLDTRVLVKGAQLYLPLPARG